MEAKQLFYYGLVFLFGFFGKYCQVKFGRSVKSVFDLLLYVLITGSIASVFFFIMSGFNIKTNIPTTIYSVIYAAIVVLVHFSSLLLYRELDVSSATVLSSTLTLVMTFVAGVLFLKESVGTFDILRCAIMIMASVLLHFPQSKNNKTGLHINIKGLFLVLIYTAISVSASVIANLYSKDERVFDSNSFFFLTNVFVVIFMLAAIVFVTKGKMSLLSRELKAFSAKGYILTAASTVSSNLGSLVQILIFASGDGITLYTPIAGALGLISTGLVAVLLKERPKIIPLLLACASLFIGLL